MQYALAMSWNIRGLGRLEKRVAVKKNLAQNRVKILLLQESKLDRVDTRIMRQLCGLRKNFQFVFSASNGASGGLISLWDAEFFECSKSMVTQHFIVLEGSFVTIRFKCAVINVYGPNDVGDRLEVLNELSRVIRNLNMPIIVGGNFNIIRFPEEKVGVSWNRGAMEKFSEFIEDLSLIDLPLQGGNFTWSNFRENASFSRLDRFLISSEVLKEWPDLYQKLHPKIYLITIQLVYPLWKPVGDQERSNGLSILVTIRTMLIRSLKNAQKLEGRGLETCSRNAGMCRRSGFLAELESRQMLSRN
ncbi:hypothetical protein V6N13_114766 [Hibiscus sabdariffa]